jgi:hypothetical protein
MEFNYKPHPRTVAHADHSVKPHKVNDERGTGINAKIGLAITVGVGTMVCAYVFALIALVSLPDTLNSVGVNLGFTLGSGTILLISWISQAFLQLVLLPVIIVGQNIQARAADKRSESTYKDAEAVLHEAMQIQAHLAEQDKALSDIMAKSAA